MEKLRENFREACAFHSAVLDLEKKIDSQREVVKQMERTRDAEKEKACGSTFSTVVKVIPWAIALPVAGLILTFAGFLVCVALMFSMPDAIILSPISLVILFGGVGVSAVLELIPWIWWLTVSRKKHRKKQEDFAEEWNARHGGEYESAVKQTDVLLRARADYITERQAVLEFLPPDYRDGVAVAYMAKLVKDGRASDLKEALSVYDNQLHRWKLEGALKKPQAKKEYVVKTLNELNNHP